MGPICRGTTVMKVSFVVEEASIQTKYQLFKFKLSFKSCAGTLGVRPRTTQISWSPKDPARAWAGGPERCPCSLSACIARYVVHRVENRSERAIK